MTWRGSVATKWRLKTNNKDTNNMEFRGRIYKVLPEQSGTNREGKEWRRLDFIFEYFERADDRYSDKVVLSVMNDRIDQYRIQEGDEVLIGFGHNVRMYQDKWYNELRVYKLEHVVATEQTEQPAAEQSDLPFI